MAVLTAITDLATLKGYLQIPLSDTTWDSALTNIFMPAATKVVERELGHIVAQTITAERHSGGTPLIMLRELPVLYIQNVEEGWGVYNWELADQTVNAQPPGNLFAYSLDRPAEGMVTRRGPGNVLIPFVGGMDNIRIDYVCGRTSVPGDALLAFNELVGVWFRQAELRSVNQASSAFDAVNQDFTRTSAITSINMGVPYYVLELLKSGRRRPIVA